LFSAGAPAQTARSTDEPAAILEIGAAPSASLSGDGATVGPDLAVEFTPIEHWLELEFGVSPQFRRHHSAEWNTDLLFKKPWDLSRRFELMAGLGPEWVHSKAPGAKRNSLAAEAALDLMYWPTPKHRFGLFIEPAYDYNFSRGHEQSFAVSFGLLIAIP
jgi:hypothetical protein